MVANKDVGNKIGQILEKQGRESGQGLPKGGLSVHLKLVKFCELCLSSSLNFLENVPINYCEISFHILHSY